MTMLPTEENQSVAQALAKRAGGLLGGVKPVRSEYLARALEQMRADTPQIRSGGELGLRLLAQGVAQWGQNRAEKAEKAEADRLKAEDYAKALNLGLRMTGDPVAAEAFAMNPEPFLKAHASRYEAANVGQGDTRVFGQGGQTFTAPKFGVDDGRGYVQGPDGFTQQGELAPTQVERWMQDDRLFDNSIAQGQLDVSRGQLDVSRSNSARGWAAHHQRIKSGGYGTPGVGAAPMTQLDDDWEIVP